MRREIIVGGACARSGDPAERLGSFLVDGNDVQVKVVLLLFFSFSLPRGRTDDEK